MIAAFIRGKTVVTLNLNIKALYETIQSQQTFRSSFNAIDQPEPSHQQPKCTPSPAAH
jgi:hypothetical protein